jgi:hypothetical protein
VKERALRAGIEFHEGPKTLLLHAPSPIFPGRDFCHLRVEQGDVAAADWFAD